MKTNPSFPPRAGLRTLAFAACCLPGLIPSLASAEPAPDEAKTHTLFMGADFSIERNKQNYPVIGVTQGSFVIKVKGKEVLVPMQGAPVALTVDSLLKLTEKQASIANLTSERGYTAANDPAHRQHQAMVDAEGSLAVRDNYVTTTSLRLNNLESIHPDALDVAGQNYLADQIKQSQADLATGLASRGANLQPLDSQIETQGFDEIDVAFEVSAGRPLDKPYVILIARYREPGGDHAAQHNWFYARALSPIGADARKVAVKQGGFPPGFKLEDLQVHLYNRGEEIATNVSPKRVPLTREEAFQYVMLEYIHANRDATLPASAAMGKLPADLPRRLAAGEFKETLYVKVSGTGQALEAYLDPSCSRKVDNPYLEGVVKNLYFKPALSKGHPVDGVAQLNLDQLVL